jgi:hypothetical protein
VRSNLGVLLMSAGRLDDAVGELDAAIAASEALGQPPSARASAHFNRGKALGAAGRLAEADDAYLQAARAAAGADLSTFGKALAAARALPRGAAAAGARAAAAARAVMAARPGLGFLAKVESTWPLGEEDGGGGGGENKDGSKDAGSDGDGDDGDGDSSEPWPDGASAGGAWLEAGSAQDLSWLHFALYGAAHRAGARRAAWSYLQAGNRLMASSGAYDAAPERTAAAQIMDIFQGPFGGTGGPPGSEGAIFVVGLPRSGSTLIEQMLGSHSQVGPARGGGGLGRGAAVAMGPACSVRCAPGCASSLAVPFDHPTRSPPPHTHPCPRCLPPARTRCSRRWPRRCSLSSPTPPPTRPRCWRRTACATCGRCAAARRRGATPNTSSTRCWCAGGSGAREEGRVRRLQGGRGRRQKERVARSAASC